MSERKARAEARPDSESTVSVRRRAKAKPAKTEVQAATKAEANVETGSEPKPDAKPDAKPVVKPAKSAAAKKPAVKRKRGTRRAGHAASALEQRIGYAFQDAALRDQALTHISALSGPRARAGSYQRLEFLGDHVLGLVISDMLYRAFPDADEGELSRRLAELVRAESCADVAREIDLGPALRLGASEANAGGRSRTTILSDVCEALIGAVHIDGGHDAAAALVERLWAARMRKPVRPLRDAKTQLQEWAQARGLPAPTYREVARTGPHHDPEFRVAVELRDHAPAEGVGRSKRAAEQAAAADMLTREGVTTERSVAEPSHD